jgi:hypothetical protein
VKTLALVFCRGMSGGTCVGVGQRDLLVGSVLDLVLHPFEELHLASQTCDFLLETVCLGFGNVAFLAIRPVERGEVASNAGVDLLHAFLGLGHRVVLVAIVHDLEFAAVDGDDGVGEKFQTTAQCNKLAAHRPYRGTVVAAKVDDGLEIRRHPPDQPHHLQIAARFRVPAAGSTEPGSNSRRGKS